MRNAIEWAACLLGIALLADAARAHAQEVAKQDGARIEEYMAACVKYRHFSGAVLVARDGKVVRSKGYGLANREQHAAPQRIPALLVATSAQGVFGKARIVRAPLPDR